MYRILPFLCLILLPVAAGAGLGDRQEYQPIIDAKPFGEMAEDLADGSRTAEEEQKQKEEIASKFRMCGITDTPDGTRKIAFVDETSGSMASYLIGIGETQNGFMLLDADYEAATATLCKDGLTFTLGLGRGLIDTRDAAAAAIELPRKPSPGGAGPEGPKDGDDAAGGSFKARLIRRRAAEKAEANEERLALQRRVAEAEADRIQANRRIQIERIKQGLAPTQPITLTPEEDAELEAAGVFGGERQSQPFRQPAAETESEETYIQQ